MLSCCWSSKPQKRWLQIVGWLEAEQLEAGCGDIGDASRLRTFGVDLVAVRTGWVVDQEWHGVEGVAGLYHRLTGLLVALDPAALVALEHLVGVAVIGRNHENSLQLFDHLHEPREL